MSPEMYAIIGVGASLAGLMVGLAGLMLYLIGQVNQRIGRLEGQFDRMEENFDQLVAQVHSLALRVAKLEWMLDAALHGRPVTFPAESETAPRVGFTPKGKAAARRRLSRRRLNRPPAAGDGAA